jgi:hypothetical protein
MGEKKAKWGLVTVVAKITYHDCQSIRHELSFISWCNLIRNTESIEKQITKNKNMQFWHKVSKYIDY